MQEFSIEATPPASLKDLITMNHPTTVTKARFMPTSNGRVVASRGMDDPNVYITDTSRRPNRPREGDKPDLTLTGHTKEGYSNDFLCFEFLEK